MMIQTKTPRPAGRGDFWNFVLQRNGRFSFQSPPN